MTTPWALSRKPGQFRARVLQGGTGVVMQVFLTYEMPLSLTRRWRQVVRKRRGWYGVVSQSAVSILAVFGVLSRVLFLFLVVPGFGFCSNQYSFVQAVESRGFPDAVPYVFVVLQVARVDPPRVRFPCDGARSTPFCRHW